MQLPKFSRPNKRADGQLNTNHGSASSGSMQSTGWKSWKACTGWHIGLRKVKILKDIFPCDFLEDLDNDFPQDLSLIKCHQVEVWEVPTGAEVIAILDDTGVEMFAIGDHILGIQGHPEYTKDILNNLIDRLHKIDSIECLPVTINVGTNNQTLLDNEFYIGLTQKRATGQDVRNGEISLRLAGVIGRVSY